MQKRVAVDAKAMFTVAFVQRKHGFIIARFRDGCESKLIAQCIAKELNASRTGDAGRGKTGTNEAVRVLVTLSQLFWLAPDPIKKFSCGTRRRILRTTALEGIASTNTYA
jgi:hypothetical protein